MLAVLINKYTSILGLFDGLINKCTCVGGLLDVFINTCTGAGRVMYVSTYMIPPLPVHLSMNTINTPPLNQLIKECRSAGGVLHVFISVQALEDVYCIH